jgi:hypothetical protein
MITKQLAPPPTMATLYVFIKTPWRVQSMLLGTKGRIKKGIFVPYGWLESTGVAAEQRV